MADPKRTVIAQPPARVHGVIQKTNARHLVRRTRKKCIRQYPILFPPIGQRCLVRLRAHQSKRCGLRVMRVIATLSPRCCSLPPVGECRLASALCVFTGDASRGGSLPGERGCGEVEPPLRTAPPVGSPDTARPAMVGGGVARPVRRPVGTTPALADVECPEACPSVPSLEAGFRTADAPLATEDDAVGLVPETRLPVEPPALRPTEPLSCRAADVPVPDPVGGRDEVVICMFRSRSTKEPRAESGRSPAVPLLEESGRRDLTDDMRVNSPPVRPWGAADADSTMGDARRWCKYCSFFFLRSAENSRRLPTIKKNRRPPTPGPYVNEIRRRRVTLRRAACGELETRDADGETMRGGQTLDARWM